MEKQKKHHNGETRTMNSLSSINSLFKESYETCKKILLSLFIITILNIVSVFGMIFLLALISVLSFFLFHNLAVALPLSIGGLIILILGVIIIGLIAQTTTFLVIDSLNKITVLQALKKSYPFLLPLFIVELATGLFTLGGYFLLVLPGILFSLFFVFAPYEVIFENHRGMKALRNSYFLVKNHFGEVFVRILIIFLLQIAIQFLPRIIPYEQGGLRMGVAFASFILSVLFGWFASVYYLLLYKQVKADTKIVEKQHMIWIYVASIIGWIIGFICIASITFFIISLSQSGQLQKIMDEYHFSNPQKPTPAIWQPQKHLPLKNAV